MDVVASGGIQVHALRRAHQVARRRREVLPLPLVHVRPDHVPVGAVELRVHVHHRLHPVIAGRDVAQRHERVAERAAVDHRRLPRSERAHVGAEEGRALGERAGAHARLGHRVARHDHEHASGDRLGVRGGGKGYLEPLRGGGRRRRGSGGPGGREQAGGGEGEGEAQCAHGGGLGLVRMWAQCGGRPTASPDQPTAGSVNARQSGTRRMPIHASSGLKNAPMMPDAAPRITRPTLRRQRVEDEGVPMSDDGDCAADGQEQLRPGRRPRRTSSLRLNGCGNTFANPGRGAQ